MASSQTKQVDARKMARDVWSTGDFDVMASNTSLRPAADLVGFADIQPGQRVLDIATGSGAVAITAHRAGASVTGLDVAPPLLERAREHCALAGIDGIEWVEGEVTSLDFDDDAFDVVVSQFGHMFGADPEATTTEMLRVVRPGGRIAFSTWPPEHYVGQMFMMNARYVAPPKDAVSPLLWGEPQVIRDRLGDAVEDVLFCRGRFDFPSFSPQHYRRLLETYFGPTIRTIEALNDDPTKLESWRREWDALVSTYYADNGIRHDYLMTRATTR